MSIHAIGLHRGDARGAAEPVAHACALSPPAARPTREATLAAAFTLAGRGLHTNRRVRVRVEPAEDGGLRFERPGTRGAPGAGVRALIGAVERQPLCTALRLPDGRLVRTVEHLLAALAAHAIDHARIVLDAEELPIFDGSAVPWCEAVAATGRRELAQARRYLRVRRAVHYADGKHQLTIAPAETFALDVGIALKGFGPLHWAGTVDAARFRSELAPARSFGRLKWALPAKVYGLVTGRPLLRGAHFGSTAAIWGGRIVGGMRVPDEPVRHRALDLVGDLALAGYPLLARITAQSPGHDHNHALLRALLTDPEAWTLEP